MAEVKALFPIGKTQWRKWSDDQRTLFNEARAAGKPFEEAVEYASNAVFGVEVEAPAPAVPLAAPTPAPKRVAKKKAK